jgi:phenylacetate-CoA ligase
LDAKDETLQRCVDVINRYRPAKMYGYPSAFALLAGYLDQHRQHPAPGLTALFTTGEPLFDFQRRRLESAFGCPASMEYSSSTAGVVAHECPERGLHIFQEGMYVEIMDPDHTGRGELVVSNLDSFEFPILRYRTGDIASLEQPPCLCGRTLPRLKAVEGQRVGFIVTPRGIVHHGSAVIKIFGGATSIREFKVIQEAVDHVVVQVVPHDRFSADENATLIGKLRLLLGNEVRVEVMLRSAIPRDRSGKLRYVESKAPEPCLTGLEKTGRGTS